MIASYLSKVANFSLPHLLWPMSIVAKQPDGSRCHLLPQPRPHCVRWGPSSPKKEAQHPTFRRMSNVYCGQTVAHLSNCRTLVKKWLQTAFFEHAIYRSHQKRAKTLRHLGRDSSALRSEVPICPDSSDPPDYRSVQGPKCLGSEVSVIPVTRWYFIVFRVFFVKST